MGAQPGARVRVEIREGGGEGRSLKVSLFEDILSSFTAHPKPTLEIFLVVGREGAVLLSTYHMSGMYICQHIQSSKELSAEFSFYLLRIWGFLILNSLFIKNLRIDSIWNLPKVTTRTQWSWSCTTSAWGQPRPSHALLLSPHQFL